MPLSKLSPRELDALEAEIAMTLADQSLPIDWAAAAKFPRVNYAAVRALADSDARPSWNKGDFFGAQFGVHGAR